MMESIKSYFLSKPGTYDDLESQTIFLKLASQNVCRVYNDHIDFISVENEETKWQTIRLDEVGENEIFDMIDKTYELIIDLLPDDEKKEVFDLEW